MKATPLPAGVRGATVALWGVGAALAGGMALLCLMHGEAGFAPVYGSVAVVPGGLALRTRRGDRWADVVSLGGLGSQVFGAVGAAWELVAGDGHNAKARHLHGLGIGYRPALAANLAYSLVAAALFARAVTLRTGPAGRAERAAARRPTGGRLRR